MKRKIRNENAITLIALIITIIVLLILAGVTIVTLTGENGILTKTNRAQEESKKASIDEQVQLAFLGSYQENGKLNYNELKANLKNIEKIEGVPDEITDEKFPLAVTIKGEEIKINQNGQVFYSGEWDKTAASDDVFIWKSNEPGDSDYGVVIGYTANVDNYTKLRFPSRCTQITFSWGLTVEENGVNTATSRSYTNNIVEIEIPGTVTMIGSDAFGPTSHESFSKLEKVTIEEGLTTIENNAFSGCKSLASVTLPNSLKNMKYGVFGGCQNITNIIIPSGVTNIESNAFTGWTSEQTINCRVSNKPEGWSDDWCSNNANVIWGYTGEL